MGEKGGEESHFFMRTYLSNSCVHFIVISERQTKRFLRHCEDQISAINGQRMWFFSSVRICVKQMHWITRSVMAGIISALIFAIGSWNVCFSTFFHWTANVRENVETSMRRLNTVKIIFTFFKNCWRSSIFTFNKRVIYNKDWQTSTVLPTNNPLSWH